jgi:uncharacterized protein YhfF
MKYLLLLPLLLLLTACDGDAEATATKSKYPIPPGWALTSDLTPQSGNMTTQILIDPQGQKFLIVRGGGISVTPYKEIKETKVEKEGN